MSYLKSKTRRMKYDKTSIEFRKECERLSKKSKGEYESLGKNDKTELFLREGLPAQKPGPKVNKELTRTQVKSSKTNVDQKACLQVQKDDLGHDTKAKNKPRSPRASGKSRKEVRLRKAEDMKTKPRLHEQGVVSIRSHNPHLQVVMQGTKIETKSEDIQGDIQEEEGKVITKSYLVALVQVYHCIYTFGS